MTARTLMLSLLLMPLVAFPAASKKKPPPANPPPAQVEPPAPLAPAVALAGVRAAPGVPAEVAAALEAGFESELRKLEGYAVTSPAEVATVLGVERQRQLFGAEASVSSVLGVLQVSEVVFVEVGPLRSGYQIDARRIARDGTLVKASQLEVGADAGALASAAVPMVAALFAGVARRAAPETPPALALRPLRVAVGDVRAVGEIPPRALAALNQSITPELRKLEAVSAIASSELRDMLGAERQRQLLGCSDAATSCLEELAGALDADELVMLDLTLVGETYALTARRTDLRKGKVVQTQLKQFPRRDGEELLAITGTSIAALYPERPLKPGRSRGVEPEVIRRLNPPPLPRWVFFTTSGVALATGLVGGAFGFLSLDAERDFQTLALRAEREPVSGAELNARKLKATSNAVTANFLFAAAGGVALAALVEIFFTDWKDDRAAFSIQPAVFGGGGGVVISVSR